MSRDGGGRRREENGAMLESLFLSAVVSPNVK